MPKDPKRSELEPAMIRRLNRLIDGAWLVILWERFWFQLWPFLIVASVFASAILFDLFSLLPGKLHLLILGAFGLGLLGTLIHGLRQTQRPTREEAIARLERDSQLDYQPLRTLLDKPAGQENNSFAQSVWLHHQDRMVKALTQVNLPFPRSSLEKRDPYSLRAALILVLVLGAIEARFDATDRLVRTFSPSGIIGDPTNWRLQAWINPPQFSGWGPIFIKRESEAQVDQTPIKMPQHSEILLRLEGAQSRRTVRLTVGPYSDPFDSLGQGTYSLNSELSEGDRLVISRGDQVLFDLPIEVMADTPPRITFRGKPSQGRRGHFNLSYHALDNYGLKEVGMHIRALNDKNAPPLEVVKSQGGKSAKGSFRQNLAHHPWAGQPVVITPFAIDNADQKSFGRAMEATLPERRFTHPIAKKLIKIRKSLYEPTLDQGLLARLALEDILLTPQAFNDDVAVYLALRVAADRMVGLAQSGQRETVQTILWESAVHLDEGATGSARNQLEFMSQRMMELMENPNDRAAMEALFEQIQQSLDHYLQKASAAMTPLDGFNETFDPSMADMVGRDELMDLLAQARDLMRTGNMEAAQAVMDKFQSILSRLAMQEPPDPALAEAAQEFMREIRALRQDQEKLLDRTFQRNRNQSKPSVEATRQAVQEAQDQKQLLQRLQQRLQTLRKLSLKSPEALREAEHAMRRAFQSLERGLDEDAVQAQTRAVEKLDEGVRESAKALTQKMGMQPMPQQLPGYDPMGRGRSGPIETPGGQMVPTEAEIRKSRDILQELYRRAGQKSRTEQELQYIERLLERF